MISKDIELCASQPSCVAMQIDQASGGVAVTNEGQQCVSFHVCGRPTDGAADAPIPDWLDVHPVSGELQPQVPAPCTAACALGPYAPMCSFSDSAVPVTQLPWRTSSVRTGEGVGGSAA